MKANLYEVLEHNGKPPVIVRAVCNVGGDYVQGGTLGTRQEAHTYVLLSALPDDLRERVKLAVQAIVSSI